MKHEDVIDAHDGSSADLSPEKEDSLSFQKEKGDVQDSEVVNTLAPTADDALKHLAKLRQQHEWDPNMPNDVEDEIDEAFMTTDAKQKIHIAEELLDNSPYPEVRSAVPNYDTGGHSNTLRAWVIGLLLSTIFSALNALFSMRQPYIVITSYVAQVVAFPIGVAWARYLPEGKFTFRGSEYKLNPGPYSKKEHTITVIMANATFNGGAAYATDILLAQRGFYKQRFGWPFEIFLCISNNMIGLGFAGLFDRLLVKPASMIWPSNLINTALFTALHDHNHPDPTKTSGWRITKYKMFYICMIGSFVWYWFPGYIAPFLSVFAWVTYIKPNSVIVNQLFGGWTGLSLIPMTFDWTQISGFNFSPLISPWHGIGNTLIGMVTWFWILTSILHYSGWAYAKFLPISDAGSYDNTGNAYNVANIIDPITKVFDVKRYSEYSPLFLSTTFALNYGLSFASITAVLTHTALFHGKSLVHRVRHFHEEEEDVHARIMGKYKKVPLWWFLATLLTMFGISMVITQVYDTKLTWWALILSFLIAAFFFVPIGMVQATTNIQIGLNVITEFIIGYMQPGRPMAMMLFKAYGYIAMYNGIFYAQDMKLGHYMKIPPRVTFMTQLVAGTWCAVVQVAVVNWAFGSIKDVCTPHQSFHFSCPNARVFFNASIIWGAIGPARIFSSGQIYHGMLYFFIPGAILPVIIYFAARRWPKSPIRYLNAPVIFGGAGLIPPATPLNYLSWGIVGFVFNKYIRNRYRGWWMQYNYVLSAGLDVGLALSTILIFLALQLSSIEFPTWWGTSDNPGGSQATLDALGEAIQVVLPEGQKFGPATW